MKTIVTSSIALLTALPLLAGAYAGAGGPPPQPEVIAADMVANYDVDGNGALTEEELTVALEETRPPRPPAGGKLGRGPGKGQGSQGARDCQGPQGGRGQPNIDQIFERADSNSDGVIDKEELKAALKRLRSMGPRGPGGPPPAPEE